MGELDLDEREGAEEGIKGGRGRHACYYHSVLGSDAGGNDSTLACFSTHAQASQHLPLCTL
eukprot:351984-Chlamydomonas_euryale.AAC.2